MSIQELTRDELIALIRSKQPTEAQCETKLIREMGWFIGTQWRWGWREDFNKHDDQAILEIYLYLRGE